MATDTNTASIIPLHQPKTPLTPAQRARAYRLRQKAAGKPMTVVTPAVTAAVTPPVTTVTPSRITKTVTPSRGQLVPVLLTVTAFGLALVGITMNGSFAIPTVSKRVGVGSSTEPPQYPVVIGPLDPEDGGGFFAVVLDLPGCFSDGATAQEALTNVQDAITC